MGSTDHPSSSGPIIFPTQDNLSNSAPPSPISSSRGPTVTPSSSIPISSSTASTVTPSSSIPSASDPEKKHARDQRVASLKSQVENLQKQLDEVIVNQDEVNSKLKYVLKNCIASFIQFRGFLAILTNTPYLSGIPPIPKPQSSGTSNRSTSSTRFEMLHKD
ncbi:hypothetical protein BGX38DRAFT_1189879 [Terfezia claveryi]|nr:hypothetical protein BGX38DRAFT_1189879 [Terfezia claveryi]